MRKFQKKNKWRSFFQSKPVLVALCILIVLFSWKIFGLFSKWQETNNNRKIIGNRKIAGDIWGEMINGIFKREIWLYGKPLDFRKQLNGLVEMVAAKMEKAPNDGSIYVFRSKGKDKIKILFWDRNGFWLGYKGKYKKVRNKIRSGGEGGI